MYDFLNVSVIYTILINEHIYVDDYIPLYSDQENVLKIAKAPFLAIIVWSL